MRVRESSVLVLAIVDIGDIGLFTSHIAGFGQPATVVELARLNADIAVVQW